MKKIVILFVFIVWGIIIPFTVAAGTNDSALHTKVAQWLNNNNGIRFLENKGQMMDLQRKPVPNVLYEAASGGMNVYVTNSGLSYVFVKLEKHKKKNSIRINFKHANDSITETWCRADMQLVGSSIKKENIIKEGESTDRTDYYYGDICPDGILGVHSYSKITIKNIYPGIDWVLHGGKKGLKYDFIVHPGANPSLIKLKYKWTNKPQLQEDGSVKINTPMGSITEGTPASYCSGEKVRTTYAIKDSEIHFNISEYTSTQALVIDPRLVWATYYGQGRAEEVTSIQEDGKRVWITGGTTSTTFPTYNPGGGAYFQDTLGSPLAANIYILEFNVAGVLQWCTYYGGTNEDGANSIYSDGTNVWLTGYTSSADFPTYNPGGATYYQGILPGGENAFILKFTVAGVRKWATYYGGSNIDLGNSIQSDGKNVWITGETRSVDFPILNPGGGAYYQSAIGGRQNAFILQFDTGGVRKWGTYYGGAPPGIYPPELAMSIYSDGNNVWVTGYASSTNFPTLNPGKGAYFQAAPAGLTNSFILQFNTVGVCKWATYYGGNDTIGIGDWGMSIYSDRKNVWVTGLCSSSNFPTYNPGGGAYFQGSLASKTTSNVYILKFDTTGVCKWATCYGGSGRANNAEGELGYSIQSDGKNVWIGGATISADFPKLNSGCGYYDDTLGQVVNYMGDQDAFILEFDTGGVRKWATYYGADDEDDGSYVCSDGYNVFMAGDAETYADYPAVNPGDGAYYQALPSGLETVWIGKFIIGGQLSIGPGTSICRGDSTRLSASGAVSYRWKPSTGLSDTNTANPYAKPKITTTYTVTGVDTGACAGTYRDSITILVDTLPGVALSKDTSICKGSSVTLKTTGGYTYKWSTGATTSSIVIVDDSASATYTVKITNGACQRDSSVKVTVVPLPNPVIAGKPFKCEGTVDTFTVSSSVNPTTYLWANGSTSTSIITDKLFSDTTIYVTAYNSLGCPAKDSFKLLVKPYPGVTVNPPTIACSGIQTRLKAVATGTGPFTYTWSPGGKTTDTITVNPDMLTYYSVTVSNGCPTTETTWVKPDSLTLSACCNTTIFTGDDTILVAHSPTAKSYQWSPTVTCLNPSCDSVQVSPTINTTYTVISTDSAGCQVERIITIVVDIPCSDFIVPNVFTPGYPGLLGINNVFYINTPNVNDWSITIYDRWGKEMFHSTNPTQYWDGNTESGGKAPDGVYYYIINATCRGTRFNKNGYLQLVR